MISLVIPVGWGQTSPMRMHISTRWPGLRFPGKENHVEPTHPQGDTAPSPQPPMTKEKLISAILEAANPPDAVREHLVKTLGAKSKEELARNRWLADVAKINKRIRKR